MCVFDFAATGFTACLVGAFFFACAVSTGVAAKAKPDKVNETTAVINFCMSISG
jgi:hypothetical protein